jgi:DNA-binding GntR family transcriptional regulator
MKRTKSPGTVNTEALADLSNRITQKSTVPEQVAKALRELILNGDLRPGDAVVESVLARQLSVGQPTVREALKTLEVEGLIERQLNRGCTVMKLTPDDLKKIYALRQAWEPMAVEQALQHWTPEKAKQLQAAFASLTAASKESRRAYYDADLAFHRTIWDQAENRYLVKALNQIVLPIFAFLVIQFQKQPLFETEKNTLEHKAIVDSMVAQDEEGAKKAMRASLSHTGLVNALKNP